MDKSWMNKPRYCQEYLIGLEKFLEFAFSTSTANGMILCPCTECKLGICVRRNDAREHLIVKEFIRGYDQWIAHGEFSSSRPTNDSPSIGSRVSTVTDNMFGLIHDVFGVPQRHTDVDASMESIRDVDIATGVAEKFYKLIDGSQKRLYKECENFSKLSFIIRLLHLKCLGRSSNKIFYMHLELLREAFPEAMTDLPKSYYECEKLMKDLGLGYEKIDACPNDCTFYWGVDKERTSCKTCNEPRWRTSEKDPTGEKRKIAHKVLWYFPIKPRLQRLFMSSKTACHMRWHAEGTTKRFDDDTLRKAHQYVLFNSETVKPYIEQHRRMVEESHPRVARHQIEHIHCEEFANWFSNHVKHLQLPEEDQQCQELKLLARGPNIIGLTYKKYVVNGFKFHTKELESKRKTQNSGVTVRATTSSFSSTRDQNPILSELDYYGVLTDIIELDYVRRKVVLFGCDWVSKGKRLKQDNDGFTLANFANVNRHNEPFILSSQATQVFYVADPVDTNWHVVISTSARSEYNMQPMADIETYLQSNLCNPVVDIESEEVIWVREDDEGVEINIAT